MIAFHGCLQTVDDVNDAFYGHAGYNPWAEANGVVVIYPQAIKSDISPYNPNGCFDWWGYTGSNYALKSAPQMETFRNMLHSLTRSQ